jgi:hypothetical protein
MCTRTRTLKFSLITSELHFNVEIYPRIHDKNDESDDISRKPGEQAVVEQWSAWKVAHTSLRSIGVMWIRESQR